MSGINFGDLDADKEVDTTPKVVEPSKPRKDYKKKYEETKKELDSWIESAGERSRYMDKMAKELAELKTWTDAVKKDQKEKYELTDEIHRLTVQGNMDKKALNKTTMQLAKLQFNPQKFSQMAQILTYMRLHGTKAALKRVEEIVGTTEIGAVRKWIFDVLEDPYK